MAALKLDALLVPSEDAHQARPRRRHGRAHLGFDLAQVSRRRLTPAAAAAAAAAAERVRGRARQAAGVRLRLRRQRRAGGYHRQRRGAAVDGRA
eukprot:SM011127S18852  [mRNA]  locus=s11127:29:459:+ [translate_table: standard]